MLLGNPVRQDISGIRDKREEAFGFFALDRNKPVLLVVGGSLGALSLNESMELSLRFLYEKGVQLIWQTGKSFHERALGKTLEYSSHGLKAFDFIQRMDLAYAAADAVVSRAGAIAISELCVTGKPCILVPSPNVAEDHQTKNAMALTTRNAALLVTDANARESLGREAVALLENSGLRESLSKNILSMAFPDAANQIAHEVIRLMKP